MSGKEGQVSISALIGNSGIVLQEVSGGCQDMLRICNMFSFDFPKFHLPLASVTAHRDPQDLVYPVVFIKIILPWKSSDKADQAFFMLYSIPTGQQFRLQVFSIGKHSRVILNDRST